MKLIYPSKTKFQGLTKLDIIEIYLISLFKNFQSDFNFKVLITSFFFIFVYQLPLLILLKPVFRIRNILLQFKYARHKL